LGKTFREMVLEVSWSLLFLDGVEVIGKLSGSSQMISLQALLAIVLTS
jgi:hypothetical protein